MLGTATVESLSNLKRLPKRVKDFERFKFKEDLEAFFNQLSHYELPIFSRPAILFSFFACTGMW
jgi:hypothetical protein